MTPGVPTITLAASGSGIGISLGVIILLGIGAQWIAWRVRVPSILLLLILGLLAGPGMRHFFPDSILAINPDEIFGSDLLLALVGASVGLILYEGGLTLKIREIRDSWRPVVMLVSVGALVTWGVALASAHFIFGLPLPIATLLGAVLIVTGPTVIGPMLSHIRPSGPSGKILKWEGIVIDPIGVGVAVLVFEAIVAQPGSQDTESVIQTIAISIVAGVGIGAAAAIILKELLNRFWVPDFLQNPVSLMLVVVTFEAANQVKTELGLLATTVMGVILANQRKVNVHHILEFKENLRVLLISVLFIVLAARLRIEDLRELDLLSVLAFLAILIVVARPLGVFLSTIGAGMSIRDRLFLCLLAPRGIVAAAGAAIFALGLEAAGVEGAQSIVPLTFAVIIGTVAFYGVAAPIGAKYLGVADQNPQGVLFIGAGSWVRSFAGVLRRRGFRVQIIDTNRANVRAALMGGLEAHHMNVLTTPDHNDLDLQGIGRVFATTTNDEVNTLALQGFKSFFDSACLYRLPPVRSRKEKRDKRDKKDEKAPKGSTEVFGRVLFGAGLDSDELDQRLRDGWIIKATTISSEFSYKNYRLLYGDAAIPLCTIGDSSLAISTVDAPVSPSAGETIISLVNPDELIMSRFTPEAGEGPDA